MTCAKRQVRCDLLVYEGNSLYQVRGTNRCENPQPVCPRDPLEETYEKCQSICQQAGHAEIVALREAEARGLNVKGATAVLYGHYHVCQPCAQALRDAGVATIIIHVE